MRPMLATRGTHVPTGDEWVHEVKWDGMRALVDVHDGRLRLTSRNENDVTVSFPELHGLPGDDLLLDAEVVAFLDGLPTFGALQERIHVGSGIAGKVGPMLMEALAPYGREASPFADEVPRLDALGTHWVEPVLVVDVESLGLSPQQRLRQPSYRGVRPDLNPEDLT